jgi:hypothetical protein
LPVQATIRFIDDNRGVHGVEPICKYLLASSGVFRTLFPNRQVNHYDIGAIAGSKAMRSIRAPRDVASDRIGTTRLI